MAEPILYQFVASGHGDVVSAIRGIDAAARESARNFELMGRAGERAGRETERGSGGTRRGLTEVQRLAMRVAADQERAAKRASAAQEREAQRAATAAERAGKARERAAQQTAKAEERAAQQAAKAQERAYEYVYRLKQRYLDKEERDAERSAQKIARAQERARARFLKDPISAVPHLVRSGVSAVAGLGMSAFQTGAHLVGGAVRESLEAETIANRVSIGSRKAGETAIDPTVLRKEFESAAIANPGVTAKEVGEAAKAYIELTGDVATARASLGTFATVATATGAKIEDVATAAASLGEKFDIKKADDMRRVMAALAFQGKDGAIELKDVATQFQRLASAGAAFGMEKGPAGVAKLGGLLQIARQGTGSARMAATAVENVFAGLTAKGGKIPGLKVYNKDGSKRDINAVLADAVSLAGGTSMQRKEAMLLDVFGRQGIRAVNPLMNAYRTATEGKTGKAAQEAGHAAVLKVLTDMANAGADWTEIQKDAAQAQSTASAQLSVAWEQLKAVAGERLAPKLAELAGRLAGDGKALDLFIGAVGLAADTLEALAAKLQQLGLISGGSPEERTAAAENKELALRKQLDALGGEAGYAKLSPEQRAKYNTLYTSANAAREEAERAKAEGVQQTAAVTRIRATTKWSGPGGGAEAMDAAYKAAGGSPWTTKIPLLGSSDLFQGLFGETAAQRDIRHVGEAKQRDVFRHSALGAEADAGSGDARKQLDELAASAAKAKAALDAIAPPGGSLTGAPPRPLVPGASH